MNKCEACEERRQSVELIDKGFESPDVSYKICNNCLFNLVNTRLSPKQFKNLLKNGHDVNEFYLHSDFYEEDGTATQPKFEVD